MHILLQEVGSKTDKGGVRSWVLAGRSGGLSKAKREPRCIYDLRWVMAVRMILEGV